MEEPSTDTKGSGDAATTNEQPTVDASHNPDGAGTANENKFQTAIAAWRNVDLTSLVPKLDTAASDLVAQQRDALTSRKDLAQKTKDFRKLDDPGKLTEIKSLLKSYQTFIDLLTNQSKSIQSAFFQAYTPLSEAPDPYPLLEASVDSLVVAEETLPKVTEENQQLQRNLARLTNQLEETEKRLEEERSAKQAREESRDAKVKEVEASWSAVLREKQDNWEAKERSLEEKVQNQDRLLQELKASYEVSQRLGKGDDGEGGAGRGNASAAELEIVSSELDRANMRLADVEARNEQLRVELAQAASQSDSRANVPVEEDPSFLRLRSENSSLLRKLESARMEKDSHKRKIVTETRSLEREVASLKSDRDALKEKLQRWGDYESVKQELEMLKSIEFATGDDGDFDADNVDLDEEPTRQNGSSTKSKAESLEQLLLARNKKLNNELTVLRVSHQDLQSRLQSLQDELSNTNMELERSKNLSATLENDLLKMQQEASNAFNSDAVSVAPTYKSRYPASAYGSRRGRSSPTSSIISGFDPGTSLDAIRAGEPVGGGSGILPMVTAQRDRFKKRNSELEADIAKAHQDISSLRSEIASLQRDNLSLYEKTRYVSTYSRGQPAASSSAYSANPSTIQMSNTSSGLSVDDRYRPAYEQNISPFAAFRGRESARAMKRITVPERLVFRITRMVLQTRTSRNLFAGYLLALHLLVLYMLFSMGSMSADGAASHLSAAGAAAAAGPLAGKEPASHGDWQQEGFQQGGSG